MRNTWLSIALLVAVAMLAGVPAAAGADTTTIANGSLGSMTKTKRNSSTSPMRGWRSWSDVRLSGDLGNDVSRGPIDKRPVAKSARVQAKHLRSGWQLSRLRPRSFPLRPFPWEPGRSKGEEGVHDFRQSKQTKRGDSVLRNPWHWFVAGWANLAAGWVIVGGGDRSSMNADLSQTGHEGDPTIPGVGRTDPLTPRNVGSTTHGRPLGLRTALAGMSLRATAADVELGDYDAPRRIRDAAMAELDAIDFDNDGAVVIAPDVELPDSVAQILRRFSEGA